MASRPAKEETEPKPRGRPATTPEAREQQIIAAAVDEAERQIIAGTVSAQVLTHYLKLASTRERLEQERLTRENHLLEMKAKQIQQGENIEKLYAEAIDAMRSYRSSASDILEDPNVHGDV